MFAGETWLSFIFRLLNFAFLILLFVYLFKRYGLPIIRRAVEEQKKLLHDLELHKATLGAQEQYLEQAISEQESMTKDLGNKIERWHEAYMLQQQKYYEEQNVIAVKNKKRRELQHHYRTLEYVRGSVMAQALQRATLELRQRYEGSHGEEFVNDLIVFMEHRKP